MNKDTFDEQEHVDQSYRDSIGTIGKDGKRKWVFPIQPKGRLYNLRGLLSIFYLIVLFTLPFLKMNGHPMFLFNVLERKFILFGSVFWPQDLVIFGIAMITLILFVILFTVAFGRIFCGWVCPQTIFMEMVFRKIEYWIDGTASQQIKLKNSPWTSEKVFKRTLKHLVFYAISFLIANTFLAYIIGVDELFKIITEPVSQHVKGLIMLMIFSGVFYFVFAWFREQVCLIACPYGRLQGVMLDKNSIVVAYDYKRGEPRGKVKKGEDPKLKGDCIDCGLCVKVCPTAIDIRNGTQLECVNCTACIDACDEVMVKIDKPKGLIRFASENAITKGVFNIFNWRTKAYSIVLIILLGVLITLISSRVNIETTVLRAPGLLFQKTDSNHYSNIYMMKTINKTYKPVTLRLVVVEPKGAEIKLVGDSVRIKPESKYDGQFFIILPSNHMTGHKTKVLIDVYQGDKKLERVKTAFLGPIYQ
ncbi:MAG TPA: cytochrome c oxidase accessory protein CcoG [Bacteroidia bacterium]